MRKYKKRSYDPFALPPELQEKKHIPFSEWTVDGRPVSEYLRKPPYRSPELISRPPVKTYGDFIPVPPSKKPVPQISDIYDQIFELKKLIRERNKA